MSYKYSICYPDKEEIEYRNSPISGSEVLNIASNYPWQEQLQLADSLDEDKLCFNPSLDFSSIENGKSFCLTANYDDKKQLEFSLWYNRPKKTKVLFGLLGEKEEMTVDDAWAFNFNEAIKYLEHFIDGKYSVIEELFEK